MGRTEHACWFMYEREVIAIPYPHGTRGETLGLRRWRQRGSFWGWRSRKAAVSRPKGALTGREEAT